jgi:hypothetical protein
VLTHRRQPRQQLVHFLLERPNLESISTVDQKCSISCR